MRIGQLTLLNGEGKGEVFLLKNLSVFEGGRSQGNHILLKDSSVAMSHFRICRNEEEYSIYCLGSSSGIQVNGEPTEKADLLPGDVIQAGELRIQFELGDENAEGRLASSAPDMNELESQYESASGGGDGAGGEPALQPALVVIEGSEKEEVFFLAEKDRFLIGRVNGADIRLRDTKISRNHCVVERVRDHFIVMDQGSSNGTVVNGERVRKTVLKEGDYVRLGFTILRFEFVKVGTPQSG